MPETESIKEERWSSLIWLLKGLHHMIMSNAFGYVLIVVGVLGIAFNILLFILGDKGALRNTLGFLFGIGFIFLIFRPWERRD